MKKRTITGLLLIFVSTIHAQSADSLRWNSKQCISDSLVVEELPIDSIHRAVLEGNKVKISRDFSKYLKLRDKHTFNIVTGNNIECVFKISKNGVLTNSQIIEMNDYPLSLNEIVFSYFKQLSYKPGYVTVNGEKKFVDSSMSLTLRIY